MLQINKYLVIPQSLPLHNNIWAIHNQKQLQEKLIPLLPSHLLSPEKVYIGVFPLYSDKEYEY